MPVYPIRRRPRECKTCLQCRASKVRCDRNVPCSNCVKRGFDCTYGRPPPSAPKPPSVVSETFVSPAPQATLTPVPPPNTSPAYSTNNHDVAYGGNSALEDPNSDTVSVSHFEWEEINSKMRDMEKIISSLKALFQAHSAAPPRKLTDPRPDVSPGDQGQSPSVQSSVYGPTTLQTGSVHIGSRSALVDILDKSDGLADTAQVLPKDDLLTELALGNESAAYPFVDLWSSDPYTFNIGGVCDVLPDDTQCLKLLSFYKDIGNVLYPVLPDMNQLETNMRRLLEGRKQAGGVYRPDPNGLVKPFGMSIAFLSLCFAVLASGSQLSDLSGIEREMTSWVYVSCSYQCLRMLNYVSQPTVEVIQILLIISSVLSYNMNAGASYTLLGMTERMCMVLGLHVETPGYPPVFQEARRRVWWAMAFQNSHFSLAYDRPSITMISQPEIPYDPKSMPGHRSYFETLSRIILIVLEMLRELMMSHHSHLRPHEIRDHIHRIERVIAEAAPHLRSKERCHTMADNIQRAELRLHSSYYISVMCRVSLDPEASLDKPQRAIIRHDCLTNLIGTIEAFIELHDISPYASRTWISAQRTIASTFLLIANTNDQLRPKTWDLVQRLEKVLVDHVNSDKDANFNSRTESAKHLSSSLQALREVSAALRANKGPAPAANPTKHDPLTPGISPATTLPSPLLPNLLASMAPYTEAYGIPLEDEHLGNILNQVSDVMLFPSLNIGNP